MKLVVDTNIIISALVRKGLTRGLIIFPGIKLFTPEITFEEIKKHTDLIITKSKLTKKEINQILDILRKNIKIVPDSKWLKYYSQAEDIIGKTDPNDVPFIAVALAIAADGIWSNDNDFDLQSVIKTWKTTELAQELGFIE